MPHRPTLQPGHALPAPPTFEIRRAFWGYTVRGSAGPTLLLQIAQGIVLALGATCTAAAPLLLVTAPVAAGSPLEPLRGALALALALLALLFLWFATRGGVVELQFDLLRGELREMVRHRIGSATLLGRHGLDARATLHIRPGAPSGGHLLVLRLPGDAQALCIAEGPEPVLQELRRRLTESLRLAALERSSGPGRLAA